MGKTARERSVIIQVEVSFKDADAVLALVEELGLLANVTLPTLARARTVRNAAVKPKRKRNKGYHVMTSQDVSEIFRLNKEGRANPQIAAAVGCGPTSVRSVIEGRHWRTKKMTKAALETRIAAGK